MDCTIARSLALLLMEKHGLEDWKLLFDNAKRRFGFCNSFKKIISLSHHLVSLNGEEKVKDTILHEIAHALANERYGFRNIRSHGREWRREARAIGCNGERCYNSNIVETPQHKYEATCSKCGRVNKAFKMGYAMKNGQSCGDCCRKYNFGRFTQEFLLVWKAV